MQVLRELSIERPEMKLLMIAVFAVSILATPGSGWAQSPASLLVTTDTSCEWKLDGVSQGRLNADDAKVVKTTAGEHLLQATSADGQVKWQGTVTADSSAQKLVNIPLADMRPTWTDTSTGLMWARKDNGTEVDRNQAKNYCTNLRLAGSSGWRLPSSNELSGIFDETQNVDGWHVKGGIRLTGWMWTSTAANDSGEIWIFNFASGKRYSNLLAFGSPRALCVR
jgi:hypothetical protein